MYSRFKLSISSEDVVDYEKQGERIFEEYRTKIQRNLQQFINEDNVIDGNKLQEEWFSSDCEFDVFLSHSHQNKKLAIQLAGFLHQKLELTTFIDSCLWGYSNDLLLKIDNTYCKNPSGDTYSYEKRNCSTSHVHMMLSIALMTMMDKCEAVFFLNTPESICLGNVVSGQETSSPWIYNELSLANIIRTARKPSKELKKLAECEQKDFAHYNLDKALGAFYDLSMQDLINCGENRGNQYALDYIYDVIMRRDFNEGHGDPYGQRY